MDKTKLNELTEIFEKGDYGHKLQKSILDFCNENKIKLRNNEQIEFLIELSKSDIFSIHFIGNSLRYVVNESDDFVNLIIIIFNKIKNDLVQGPLLNSLILIGKNDPELGLKIMHKFIEKDAELSILAAYILGGVGQAYRLNELEFKKIWNLVLDFMNSPLQEKRTIAVHATKIIHEKSTIDKQVIELFERGIKDPSNQVQRYSLEACLDFYTQDPDKFFEHIANFAKSDKNFKFAIANRLWIKPISNSEHVIKILQICATEKDHAVHDRTLYALTKLVDKYPEKILEIIHDDLLKGGTTFGTTGYLLQELGKASLESSFDVIGSWLAKDNKIILFNIPHVVVELLHNRDKIIIFPFLEKWYTEFPTLKDTIFKIHNSLISDELNKPLSKFITQSFELLSNLCKVAKLDPVELTKTENDSVLKCSMLIHYLQYYSNDLNYDRIVSNLKNFPYLSSLLDDEWITKMKKSGNRTHLLLRVLEREFPEIEKIQKILGDIDTSKDEKEKYWNQFRLENVIHDLIYLSHLESNLKKMSQNNLDIIAKFKKKLKNDTQTSATISEINFIASFVGKCQVEIEPTIIKKRADVLLEIDSQKVYVEVISPEMFKELDLLEGVMRGIPNRIKNKILDEYKDQLFELDNSNYLVLLVIDTTRSLTHIDEIEDALLGDLQYTFLMDSKTHEDKGGYWSRKDNALHTSTPRISTISAVLCFRSELFTDFTFHNVGEIIDNPKADNPIGGHIEKRIKEMFFE